MTVRSLTNGTAADESSPLGGLDNSFWGTTRQWRLFSLHRPRQESMMQVTEAHHCCHVEGEGVVGIGPLVSVPYE